MYDKVKELFKRYNKRLVIGSYIAICILIFIFGMQNIKEMVLDYNEEQAGLVTGLLVKNVNSELDNIVTQIERVSIAVLQNDKSNDDKLKDLKNYQENSYFYSIGFFDSSNKFYGDYAEKQDLFSYGFIHQGVNTEKTRITNPYRSSITGQYILTVFVPVYDDMMNKIGVVYANLELDKISFFANENSVSFDTKIFMFNSKSLNYIACTEMTDATSGSWNSLMITRENMTLKDDYSYDNLVAMINDKDTIDGVVGFMMSDIEYTIGYSRIDKMPNWFMIIAIENNELSDTITRFGSNISIFLLILFAVTLVYALIFIFRELSKRKEYQKLSTLDTMTGVYNKRTFVLMVEEFIKSGDGRNIGSLMFIDVDDFKKYNDEYGHLNGDIVLKKLAKFLADRFNSIGYVGRYGGDEFVVFVKDSCSKKEIAGEMFEVKKQFSNIELNGFGNVHASISVGGASYPADASSFEELCDVADKALYQVKRSGKGKFYWY